MKKKLVIIDGKEYYAILPKYTRVPCTFCALSGKDCNTRCLFSPAKIFGNLQLPIIFIPTEP